MFSIYYFLFFCFQFIIFYLLFFFIFFFFYLYLFLIYFLKFFILFSYFFKFSVLFDMWDFERTGYISKEEMETMLKFIAKLAVTLQENTEVSMQKLGTSISLLTDPKKFLKEAEEPIKIFPINSDRQYDQEVFMEVDPVKILVDKMFKEVDPNSGEKITFKVYLLFFFIFIFFLFFIYFLFIFFFIFYFLYFFYFLFLFFIFCF